MDGDDDVDRLELGILNLNYYPVTVFIRNMTYKEKRSNLGHGWYPGGFNSVILDMSLERRKKPLYYGSNLSLIQ